jgi:hypothetical protein
MGLVPHFCNDLTERAASLSTGELKNLLLSEFGNEQELILQRFALSSTHALHCNVAQTLADDYAARIGWYHWTRTGHIATYEERSPKIADSEKDLPRARTPASASAFKIVPTTDSQEEIAKSAAVVLTADTEEVQVLEASLDEALLSVSKKPRIPKFGPYVVGEYDKYNFWKGYEEFMQLIARCDGRSNAGEVIKGWKPFEEFICAVVEDALSVPAMSADEEGENSYRVNVKRLEDPKLRGSKENLARQLENKFENMISRLIGRRIILRISSEGTDAKLLARKLGYAKGDDDGYNGMTSYMHKCGMNDPDYQKPYESENNARIVGELQWLKTYR